MNLKSDSLIDNFYDFDSVGMDCPREGLNNQRIALYGLLAYCMENNKYVSIPNYCIDHIPKPFLKSKSFPEILRYCNQLFYYYLRSKLFKPRISLAKVFSFNSDNSLHCHATPSQILPFKQALYIGFDKLASIAHSEDYKRLFRSISFAPNISSIVTDVLCFSNSFANGAYNCISLRLEKDWLRYINSKSFVGDPSEICLFTKSNILNQMVELFQATGVNSFYCCFDHNDLPFPFEQFRIEANSRGIFAFSKRDLEFTRTLPTSSLASASIDYIIALHSVAYLGSTRSTFSNLIALDSYLSGNNQHRDYAMNLALNQPILRTDHGL